MDQLEMMQQRITVLQELLLTREDALADARYDLSSAQSELSETKSILVTERKKHKRLKIVALIASLLMGGLAVFNAYVADTAVNANHKYKKAMDANKYLLHTCTQANRDLYQENQDKAFIIDQFLKTAPGSCINKVVKRTPLPKLGGIK